MDPDSRRLRVSVSDHRGRPVRDGGLARWLALVAPPRVRGEVAVALAPDTSVRALNRQYRGKDVPTDVLAFEADVRFPQRSASAPLEPAFAQASAGRRSFSGGWRSAGAFLGDIIIATGVARRQARAARHAYRAELRVLALHGLLHLLGYDHEDPADRGAMARVEARLRKKGGLPAGLIDRTTARGPARTKQRLRPERGAGQPPPRLRRPAGALAKAGGKRGGGAPPSESERGWGPASTKR